MDSRKTLWISHSAISDFDKCSRLYYFKSIYRNPKTGNRVQIVNPYLSLGLAVHKSIDEVLDIAPSKRVNVSVARKLEKIWENYGGKKGGFISEKQESEFKSRGLRMLKKFKKHNLLSKKSLKKEKDLLRMRLFKDVDLVGSFDWIEVLSDKSLHIIDFKTGKGKESSKSLQLPIYHLLAKNNYNQKVKKLSYWYLENMTEPTPKKISRIGEALVKIKKKSEEIKKSIKERDFLCSSPYKKCFWCREYESILSGRAERIGIDERMKKDLYYLANGNNVLKKIYDNNFLNTKEKDILKMRMVNGTAKEAQNSLKMTKKEMKDTICNIKSKVKDNLSQKELKTFIEELSKNGNKFYI